MKRSGAAKFPNSVQLFKFCQKVMAHQRGNKIRDQEVGSILNFNPSDCSHWKRGEKNVRSVFALEKLAEALGIEIALIHDIASGFVSLDEAFFEYQESKIFQNLVKELDSLDEAIVRPMVDRVSSFVMTIQKECAFSTPPLYLPEVLRAFSFISTQPVEMLDKLSRILRVKAGRYCIQFKKGDLKPQTRLSMVKDLARIVFEGERVRFPELGPQEDQYVAIEQALFAVHLLLPRSLLMSELVKLDSRKNVISELAGLFWVPKSLVCFQLQNILREGVPVSKQEKPDISSKMIEAAETT